MTILDVAIGNFEWLLNVKTLHSPRVQVEAYSCEALVAIPNYHAVLVPSTVDDQ
jgi:hypothetical protein